MACVTVFTRCPYVANTTATGSLLSALIQLLLLIRSFINIHGNFITITIILSRFNGHFPGEPGLAGVY